MHQMLSIFYKGSLWSSTPSVALQIPSEDTVLGVVFGIFFLWLHDVKISELFDCFRGTGTVLSHYTTGAFCPGSCLCSALSASLLVSRNSLVMTRFSGTDVSYPWLLKNPQSFLRKFCGLRTEWCNWLSCFSGSEEPLKVSFLLLLLKEMSELHPDFLCLDSFTDVCLWTWRHFQLTILPFSEQEYWCT